MTSVYVSTQDIQFVSVLEDMVDTARSDPPLHKEKTQQTSWVSTTNQRKQSDTCSNGQVMGHDHRKKPCGKELPEPHCG